MSEEKCYTLYCHTNNINGKRYIGITSKPLSRRFGKDGANYSKSRYFDAAIQKYGWNNFSHEIWHTGLSKEEAEEYERYYIAAFDTQNRSRGYNIKSGGSLAGEMSEEGKLLNILAHAGPNSPSAAPVVSFDLDGNRIKDFPYIKAACEFYCVSDSGIWSALSSPNKTCHGMLFRYAKDVVGVSKMSEEYLNRFVRVRYYKKGKHAKCTDVVVFDAHGKRMREFGSMKETAAYFGVNHGCISAAISGRIKTVHGCYIRMKSYVGEADTIDISSVYKINTIGVDQYDLSGVFLKHFSSLREAEKEVGGDHKRIKANATKGTAYRGFLWSFSG